MIVGMADGTLSRFEVVAHASGYLVRSRDLLDGACDSSGARLFRTAPVAFRFAAFSAACDRFAAASLLEDGADEAAGELAAAEAAYLSLRERFCDDGLDLMERDDAERRAARARLH